MIGRENTLTVYPRNLIIQKAFKTDILHSHSFLVFFDMGLNGIICTMQYYLYYVVLFVLCSIICTMPYYLYYVVLFVLSSIICTM